MNQLTFEKLLEAGCHFGHLKRKWNPNMAPYIFMERKGIHIIDLNKTIAKAEEAAKILKQIAKSNKKILFVGTKKQAKELIAQAGKKTNMPYVAERWPGGLLTNFATIRKSIKKMEQIENLMKDDAFQNLSKRERLQIARTKAKMEKNFGSFAQLTRLPSAIFIVDINKEHIAAAEARKLNIPSFAIVDTNTNPLLVDYPIPANDDAAKSIGIILDYITDAILEGIAEREQMKETEEDVYDTEKPEFASYELLDEESEDMSPKKQAPKKQKTIKLDIEEDEA